jgi:hypothetical protein
VAGSSTPAAAAAATCNGSTACNASSAAVSTSAAALDLSRASRHPCDASMLSPCQGPPPQPHFGN